jgi:hypothetical protein
MTQQVGTGSSSGSVKPMVGSKTTTSIGTTTTTDTITTTTTNNNNNINTISELLEWNLIDRISPYLDRHMIFPLLDYFEKLIHESKGDDPNNVVMDKDTLIHDVNMARYTLLRPTHMIDYMMDVYNSIHNNDDNQNETKNTMSDEMIQQKQQVLQDMETLKEQCLPLLEEIDTTTRVR